MNNNFTNTINSKWLSVFSILCMFFPVLTNAQVDVTATGGTASASYITLKESFDAINAGTHMGIISIDISASTTETATAMLSASGTGSSNYTSITIVPSGGGARTISGAIPAGSPLIDLNGADNVKIDGLYSGGNSLTIVNTTASGSSGTSTIRLIGGATSNTITNCFVFGSFSAAVGTNGGNIFISTDANTPNGNDNNVISYCNIGPAGSNLPTKGIYMNGSTSTAAINNSGNTILNNYIFDYFGASVSSAGIYVGGGNTDLNITNNLFYQTSPRAQTTGAQHSGIWIVNTSGNNFQVTGNTIGYASSSQTGVYSFTGVSSSSIFIPIFLNVGTTTSSNASGNLIDRIAMTGTLSGTSSSASFRGIYVAGGLASCNTNTIGSQSSTGSINFSSSSASAADVIGIFNFGSSNFVSNNNIIGGFTLSNSSTGATNFYGLRVNTGSTVTWTCNSNVIGGISANSIDNTSTASGSVVNGILNSNPNGFFANNIIRNMSTAGGTGTGSTAGMAGIVMNATSANHTLTANSIYNLNSSLAGSASINGISFNSSSGSNVIEKNLIYGLNGSNTASIINGINIVGGTATYKNNMIRLGASGSSSTVGMQINGINETTAGTNNIWNNSIYIGGNPTTGTANTFAFQSSITTNTRSYQNNIFYNARSNSGSTGKHYAIRVGGTTVNPAGLTSNNNILFSPGTGGNVGLFNAIDQTTLANWTAATGKDGASFSSDPQYIAPLATVPDLHINTSVSSLAEGLGAFIASVTEDFDSQSRSGLTPTDIGADAFNGITPAPSIDALTITPTGNQCIAVSRNVSAIITPGAAPIASVTLNYTFNGITQTPIPMTGGNFTTTSTWNATIPVGIPSNANVTWYVEVTDGTFTKTSNGISYSDEPASNFMATASVSPNPVCVGNNASLTFNLQGAVNTTTYCIIAAATSTASHFNGFSTTGGIDNITNNNSGFSPNGYGNFTSLKVSQQLGSSVNFNTNLVGTTVGVAIWVDWNHNGLFDSSERVYNTTGYVSTSSGSFIVPANAMLGATTMRILMDFNVSNPASPCGPFGGTRGEVEDYTFLVLPSSLNYSWTDGVTTFTSSTSTATFTVNATSTFTGTTLIDGCPLSATVQVNGTALPTAPTATNSTQCGVAISSASVSGGTSYNWYASPTSTTVLQSGADANYTTAIGATTTWYVSSVNGTCESPRTAITTTVSIPDGVTATTSAANLCVGSAGNVTLTAVQSGTTNAYSYSWDASPVAGSGMASTMIGGTVVIAPTLVGTYSYSVTATDGICTTISSVTVSLNDLPNISNATTTPSAICSGSTFTLNANSLIGGPQTVPTGYCTPSSSGSACITMATFNTLSRSSACETGFYIDVPASITTNVTPGQTYTLNLTTNSTAITSVWFDWNRDGVFSSTEWLQPSTTGTTGVAVVNVPMSASLGLTKMRLRSRSSGNTNGATDACSSFGSGEGEDYTINVQFDQSSDYNWTWNPGALSGNNVTASATNTTSTAVTEVYTVTATSTVTGCSNTSTTSIVVNPVPASPIVTDGTQCGIGVPTASVSGGTSYNWYASPSSTLVLQSGSSASFTNSINSTTTWYVESSNGFCLSPRVAVTQTVVTPPAFTLNSPAAICAGSEVGTFSVTSNTSDYDSYIWSPTTNIYSDASATTAYSGGNAAQVYVKSLTPGVITVNANATNSITGCASVASTTISIKNAPTSITVSATPTLICAGNTTTLSAGATPLPVVLLTEGFNGASNSWITINNSTGGTASASAWTLRNSPYSSNVGTNITSNDASQFYLTDSDAQGSGGTTATILQSPAINTMGMNSLNLSFYHYYNYYSSDVSTHVEVSTNGTSWTSIKNYKTTALDIGTPTSFSLATFNLDSYVNQSTLYVRFNYNSSYGYGWAIDNVMVNGLSANAYDFSWTSMPAGFTSTASTATAMPTTTTDYSVVITNTATSCSNSGVVTVSVNPLPTVTVSASSMSVCAGSTATLTAGGATSFSWTTGGNTATETVTVNTASVYTVTGTDNGCSNTATVSVGVNAIPTVTATASNTLLCSNFGESAVLTAVTSATSYTWSDGANTMTTSVMPSVGTTYTVTVNDGNCDATATVFVDAQICMGINSVASVSDINIYPNPTNGLLNVNISSELSGAINMELFDGLGKLVVKESLTNGANTINVMHLEEGVYFFKIINGTKTIKVGKVVRQ